MKHIRKYNESNNNKLTQDIIELCFIDAMDISEYTIHTIYADKEDYNNGLYDFFSINMDSSDLEELDGVFGFEIRFDHKFYADSDFKIFKDYLELLLKIDDAVNKLKNMYNINIIQFDGGSNAQISIQLAIK